MTAKRAPVGRRLAVRRWTHRPPARWRKSSHRPILASRVDSLLPRPRYARSLAGLALGIGLTAAAAIAVKEAWRPRPQDTPGGDDEPGAEDLRLRQGELAAVGMHRMTLAQLELAIATLEGAREGPLELAVHETRKAIKRVRTLERLRRGASSKSRRDRRKAVLREAAAALSAARDAQVALDTLEALMRRHPRRLGGSASIARLHTVLLAEHIAAERALEESGARERALGLLRVARQQAAKESPLTGGPRARPRRRDARAVEAGLARIYARGRAAMRRARRREEIAQMHEWRKRTKDLRYATEALQRQPRSKQASAKQERLRKTARRADRLGEALGEEHDLALLAERVRAEDELFRDDRRSRKALLRAIRRRRRRLRKRAFEAGGSLYRRKAKGFVKRLPRTR